MDDERQWLKAVQEGDNQALDRLLKRHERLIFQVARRYAGNDRDAFEDLAQDARVAFIHAARTTDLDAKEQFVTLAYRVMRWACQKSRGKMSTPYTVPRDTLDGQRRMIAAESQLQARLGREPTDEELAEEAHLTIEQLTEVRAIPGYVNSLHYVFERGGQLLEKEHSGDGGLNQWETHQWLEKELADLPQREAEVLRMWAGWDGEEMTFPEIAQKIGVSTQWAHEIKKRALQHLQERILARRDG